MPSKRLSRSLLIALALHAGLLMLLPGPRDWASQPLRELRQTELQVTLRNPEPPRVIPIQLPSSQLTLETRLDPARHTESPPVSLPQPKAFAKGTSRLSASLQDAARQAAAAYRRQTPVLARAAPTQSSLFPVDLSLAPIATARASDWLAAPPSRSSLKAAKAVKPAAAIIRPDPDSLKPEAGDGRQRLPAVAAALEKKPVPVTPAAESSGPGAMPANAIAMAAPAGNTVTQIYEPGNEAIATVPPLPAVEPGPAPDSRGSSGTWTADTNNFFALLTAQLFDANQRALAEAVRAGPRVAIEVRFAVDRSGRIVDAGILHSSGDSRLDDKALRTVLRASPLPRLADEMPQQRLELSYPVEVYQ